MSVECYCSNPKCKRRYTLPAASAGKSVKCTACGGTFVAGASQTKANDFMEPAWGDTVKPATASSTTVPTTIGRFAIRGKLGSGAFGTVYRAYDPQLDRVVALKVPNPGVMTDAKRTERFLREAKAAANLHHPHIVPVFDAGKDGDSYYIASAFIDGKPLADSIDEKGTDFARAARLVRELAEALAYAHEQGIVHRDVKPANVMVDAQDRVHLMDFGLASRHDEAARLTNDGAVMGTPAYMSPEQARGQKGDAQPSTDQYAAGVVLYELLTGRTPFGGPPAVVIAAVLSTEPDPPRKLRSDVPNDLETVCLKAMSKKPEDRYATCRELADDLRRWADGEPVTARPLGFRERAQRWVKKEPKLAGAVATVALVLLVSVILVSVAARRAGAAREQAERDATAARESGAQAERALADARAAREREEQAAGTALGALGTAAEERKKALAERSKLESMLATFQKRGVLAQVAHQEVASGQVSTARSLLDLLRDEDRGWEWWYVDKLCRAGFEPAPTVFKVQASLFFSASFSPDGSRIVTTGNGPAKVWDAETGAEVLVLKGLTRAQVASFSPDGSQIVAGITGGAVGVWDAKTGAEMFALRGLSDDVWSVSFSPDGSRIVAAGGKAVTARVWDVNSKAESLTIGRYDKEEMFIFSASFSPDGSRIVTADVGTKLARVWDAKTGVEVLALKGHTSGVRTASFSPDGSRIVTGSDDGTAKVWDAKTGSETLALKGHTGEVWSASFSPDGSRIVTVARMEGAVKVWNAKTGDQVFTLKGALLWAACASFSPDGMRLMVGGQDGTVQVWDASPPLAKK